MSRSPTVSGERFRPYPGNRLGPQIRDPRDGPSAYAAIRDAFFPRDGSAQPADRPGRDGTSVRSPGTA